VILGRVKGRREEEEREREMLIHSERKQNLMEYISSSFSSSSLNGCRWPICTNFTLITNSEDFCLNHKRILPESAIFSD
jgi:hypothetical protein